MICDYFKEQSEYGGTGGMIPTFDVWGTVSAPGEDTGEGNVKVQVKTMKEEMDIFDGVPVLAAYGGGEYGALWMPEEGDIVRLTFIGGDFRHPVVTGCRFPCGSQFVKDLCGKENPGKAWKSKNGCSLLFSGTEGKEKIRLSGPEKMEWELDEEQEQMSFGDKENKNRVLVDKKNGRIRLLAEQEILLECGKSSLSLKKDGTVVLSCGELTVEAENLKCSGSGKVRLQGQDVALQGTTGITVKSDAKLKLEGKGPVKLSGSVINLN